MFQQERLTLVVIGLLVWGIVGTEYEVMLRVAAPHAGVVP